MDPYREWLQIPVQGRSPNHYELLRLQQFEPDEQVIHDAYYAQMASVRRYQVGAHEEIAQRIIRELGDAYACLTTAQKKQAYDALLRGGETSNSQILATVESIPPAPSPPQPPTPRPVRREAVVPAAQATVAAAEPVVAAKTESAPPAPSASSLGNNRKVRGKRRQPPIGVLAGGIAAAAFFLIAVVLWVSSSEKEIAQPVNVPDPTVKPTSEPTPSPPPVDLDAKLVELLKQKPPPDTEASFDAYLLGFIGETVTVTPGVGTPKVAVVFPGLIAQVMTSRGYKVSDLVEVTGTVAKNDDSAVQLRIAGQSIRQVGDPATRIVANELSAPPSPPPADVVGSIPKPVVIPPSPPTPVPVAPITSPPPAATPKPPPKPALPADWAEQVAKAESLWTKLGKTVVRSRLELAGEFVGLQEGNPPVLQLLLGSTEAVISGPFSAEGMAFARRLQAQDAVQFGIRVSNTKSTGDRAELLWMARASLGQPQPIPFQLTPAPKSIAPGGLLGPVHSVAWCPDSLRLLVASRPAVIVNTATGEEVRRFPSDECEKADWNSDGRYLALLFPQASNPAVPAVPGAGFGMAAGQRGQLRIYDVSSGVAGLTLPCSDRGQALFGFRPNGMVFAAVHDMSNAGFGAGLGSKSMTQYNFSEGKWTRQTGDLFTGSARLAWNDSSQLAWAVRGPQSFVKVASAGSKGAPRQAPLNVDVADLAWVPKIKQLAVCGAQTLHISDILDAKKDKSGFKLEGGVPNLKQCSFSDDGRFLAVIRNQELQVWRLTEQAAPKWIGKPQSQWQAVAWSPTAPLLAAMNSDGSIYLWDEKGQQAAMLSSGLTVSTRAGLAWSPSGQRLAAFGQNNTISVFDTTAY